MSVNGPKSVVVHSSGIFNGLPELPSHHTGLRAIVVGASGTSGQPLVDVLSASPQRWEKVYAMSRRPPLAKKGSNVEHVPMDLLQEPAQIAETLRKHHVQADFLYFFSYVRLTASSNNEQDAGGFGDPGELAEINGRIFDNLLSALDQANITLKRIVLQCGGKNYGVHQGPVNVPLKESDPRVELEPNFYYTQMDVMSRYVKKHPQTGSNVVMPQWILGAVAGTDMTIFYPLAVYAAVQRKLNNPLFYPGDVVAWDTDQPISTGILNGMFYEWLVLSKHTAGEAFNVTDGSEFTWGKFWPVLASWYGMKWEPPSSDCKELDTSLQPRGYGPTGKLRSSFNIVEWASRPETKEAWEQLKKEHNLNQDPFKDPAATFDFLQFALTLTWSWGTSIDKSRKYGWFGHCDSTESMRQVWETMVDTKMLPPLPHLANGVHVNGM